jgi:ppGpp synthetase/RelA/SpoT-type nucleotidyltranferase
MDYASSILGFLPGGRRSTGISELLDKLEAYLAPPQVERVREAYEFGAEKHRGQKRVSGEPYITHPVAVADILADLRLDADTLVAAILHDVIEDTPTAKAEIASIFGQVVAELVDGVSKLDQIQFKNRQEAQAESFRKMLLAMVRDIRVIMVKLADRMHNMRTLGVMPPVKRRRSARETLEIYAPIAERLGLYAVKLELEDLGFRALYPYRYKVLERELKRARGNQKEFLGKIAETFKAALKKAGITGEVAGREKHLYSIYKKMQNKKISLNEMVDVYGFRIIVDSADLCYRTLGLVHSVYKPMPGRFKDYIAIPRVNGYQSLHTTLFGPNGVPIEVQIRSEQMHRVAESGIAAHWKYKSGGDSFGGIERQLRGVSRERQGRSVPRQGVRVYAEGEDTAAAERRHRGRLRVRNPHRCRQSLRGGEGRPAPGAAADPVAQRANRGNHNRQGCDAEPFLVELPGDGEGARRDPDVFEESQARRGSGTRQAPAGARARGVFAQSEEDSGGGYRRGREGTEPEGRRGALRENRLGRAPRAVGRPASAARA